MTFASGKNLLNYMYFQKDKILCSKENETTSASVVQRIKGLKKLITCLWGYNKHGAHDKSILFRRWESLL